MLTYIVLFTLIGAGVGWFVKDARKAFLIMLAIAFLWGLSNRPIWGLVTLGELMLGFGAVRYFGAKRTDP